VHLRVLLGQQRLHSSSPFTGFDGVRFFSVWKETSPIMGMGFSALIQISLTVTALALSNKTYDQQSSHDLDHNTPPDVLQKRERTTQSRSHIKGRRRILEFLKKMYIRA
jgi:hypothetical protein